MEEKKHKRMRAEATLGIIIVLTLLAIYFLCFRLGKTGGDYLSEGNASQVPPIVINQNDLRITTNTKINIFNNEKFGNKKIIAPMSKGTCKFSIKNGTNDDVVYNLRFIDEMNVFVNMKYKLKINDEYVKGNEKEYIDIDGLDVESKILKKGSTNLCTLEWFWESDSQKDTISGNQEDGYYSLNLYVFSQAYQKRSE